VSGTGTTSTEEEQALSVCTAELTQLAHLAVGLSPTNCRKDMTACIQSVATHASSDKTK